MCPHCGSLEVEPYDEESRMYQTQMICVDCGRTWWEDKDEEETNDE
jgi:predicted RNA-binding Zn-ribbon protein involved in translation (DUF1610 family)